MQLLRLVSDLIIHQLMAGFKTTLFDFHPDIF